MLSLEILEDFRPNDDVIEIYAFDVLDVELVPLKLLVEKISIDVFIFI